MTKTEMTDEAVSAGVMSSTAPSSFHLVTVGADVDERQRTEKLIPVLAPLSSIEIESLEELPELGDDAQTLIRLFDSSSTSVLTWLKANGRVASEVAILGVADAILAKPGEPLRVVGVLPQAFVAAIASTKQTYEQTGAAILIGACDDTRAIAAGVARLGFTRIQFVDSDDKKSEQMVQLLRKRIFGVKFEAVSRASVTQLPNEASLAINLMRESEASLLEDISYLNFLKVGGLWIDWTHATERLGYSEEIANAGATIFRPETIRAWREILLVEQVLGLDKRPDSLVSSILSVARLSALDSKTDPS